MNIHQPSNARQTWPQFEFIGKPFSKNRKKFIRVKYRDRECQMLLGKHGMFYCFEDDFIWFGKTWLDLI